MAEQGERTIGVALELVGDDRIIPFARLQDETVLLLESHYVDPTEGELTETTTVGQALAADRYLSDDPLGMLDVVRVEHLSSELFVPDLQMGRLVETAAEITTTIATFISTDGEVDLPALGDPGVGDDGHQIQVTGYDFLTDSAVRVTHLETGLVVTCQDEKSQHKNKAKAIKILRSRLLDRFQAEQEAEQTAQRRSMVKSGDRSDKIRTYNYPQDRLTDHRIGLTVHNLPRILEGNLGDIVVSLRTHFQAEALKSSGS